MEQKSERSKKEKKNEMNCVRNFIFITFYNGILVLLYSPGEEDVAQSSRGWLVYRWMWKTWMNMNHKRLHFVKLMASKLSYRVQKCKILNCFFSPTEKRKYKQKRKNWRKMSKFDPIRIGEMATFVNRNIIGILRTYNLSIRSNSFCL